MEKKYKALLCIVIAVWIVAIGFNFGKYKSDNIASPETTAVTEESTTVPVAATTQESTKPAVTTRANTTKPAVTTARVSTTKPTVTTTRVSTEKPAVTTRVSTAKPDVTTTRASTAKPAVTTTRVSTTKPAVTTTKVITTKPVVTTTAPATETVVTTAKVTQTTIPAEPKTVTTTKTPVVEGKSPDSWSESTIIKKVRAAINRLETNDGNFKLSEVKTVNMEITNCSEASFYNAVNNVVQGYAGEKESVYTFNNGIATDSNGVSVTPKDVLPPEGNVFKLTNKNISYAVAQAQADNIKFTIKIGSERVDSTVKPVNHSAAIGYIDFSKLSFGSVTLTDATVVYERATLSVVVDSDNKLISASAVMPVQIESDCHLGKDFNVQIAGVITYTWKTV